MVSVPMAALQKRVFGILVSYKRPVQTAQQAFYRTFTFTGFFYFSFNHAKEAKIKEGKIRVTSMEAHFHHTIKSHKTALS